MLRKKLLFFYGCLLLLASCAKEGPTGPTGSNGPSLSGSIGGHVKLYDMYGTQVLYGMDSARLYLNGTTTPLLPGISGSYLFNTYNGVAMVTGNYSVTATDSGYATTVKNNIQLVTGALNVDVKLSAIPDSFVYTFHAYHNAGSANDSLLFTFKPDTRQRYCIIFANTNTVINGQPGNYLYNKVLSIAPNTPGGTYLVPGQDLSDAGMVSGSSVFFGVYSYVINDASVYEDISTGRNVYNAISGGLADSTKVP